MKKIIVIALILLLMAGCTQEADTYLFPNKNEEIESIELLYYPAALDPDCEDENIFLPVRELEAEEIGTFMNALYNLPTKKVGPPPYSHYGPNIARVTYANGDVEYFGSWHIELVKNGEQRFAVGRYGFDSESFDALFKKFSDIGFDE